MELDASEAALFNRLGQTKEKNPAVNNVQRNPPQGGFGVSVAQRQRQVKHLGHPLLPNLALHAHKAVTRWRWFRRPSPTRLLTQIGC